MISSIEKEQSFVFISSNKKIDSFWIPYLEIIFLHKLLITSTGEFNSEKLTFDMIVKIFCKGKSKKSWFFEKSEILSINFCSNSSFPVL